VLHCVHRGVGRLVTLVGMKICGSRAKVSTYRQRQRQRDAG
jgi:predicted RNA-binding Zn ribbon-like protein